MREGSPWTGLGAVVLKELADHLTSVRMRILEILMLLAALGAVYTATQEIRKTIGEDPFVFLKLFTTAQEPLPAFAAFLGFLIPLTAIALGFDAVNGEYNRRTMSLVLSQPIYRDALLLGKFLAGIGTIAITLTALWVLLTGLGLWFLGVAPSTEEVGRALLFLFATLAYAGVWLALAILFSAHFRQPATSALAALSVWLLFTVFWTIVTDLFAKGLYRADPNDPIAQLAQARIGLFVSRLSPNTLYAELLVAFLNPQVRSLGPILVTQLEGAVMGTPLPLFQSFLIAWPQIVALVGTVIALFIGAYVIFQRQEVRA